MSSDYKKEISGYNHHEAAALMRNNLRPSISDPEVVEYVIGLLTSFMNNTQRIDFLNSGKILSVASLNAWDKPASEAYNQFRDLGEGLLFLCGFFPSSVAGRGKWYDLGLEWHLGFGRDMYHNAQTISNTRGIERSSNEVLGKVARNFRRVSRAVFEMKHRLDNKVYEIPPHAVEQIEQALYGGRSLVDVVVRDFGKERAGLRLVSH